MAVAPEKSQSSHNDPGDVPDAPPPAPPPQSKNPQLKRHVISTLVNNVPGLLAQVANLFAARGYNIESLTVGETENPRFSRMTIVVRGEDTIINALKQGLRKFVNVIKVLDFTAVDHVERDLALVKVAIPAGARQEMLLLVQTFDAKVVDIGIKEMMVEVVGPEQKIDTFLHIFRPYGVKEMARTGRLAVARGMAMEGKEVE
jgi:acetolactate synthase-1/3 small subunit